MQKDQVHVSLAELVAGSVRFFGRIDQSKIHNFHPITA